MQNRKKLIINLEKNAFDRHTDATRISSKIKNYSKEIKEMNSQVDELDRFDDFDSLRIPPEKYERTNGKYGIERSSIHRGNVIFKHQSDAALAFIRDLRGFGILADVVGSGKTYEAGLVISELAVRNKIRSILFIVPTQAKDDWVKVMENSFGMGVGTLYQAGSVLNFDDIDIKQIGGYLVPRKAIIVTDDDFVKWDNSCTDLLFDVIVVDEAHHLCAEEGKYSYAMRILSQLIELKRKAKSSYCVLLSATPHSGNLEKMFRLWYFVRCTGGKPDDFDEKEDAQRSQYYVKEKEYYKNYVCKGASTVMEFIETVKIEEVLSAQFKDRFDEFLSSIGELNYFYQYPKGKQNEIVSEFLFMYENEDVKEKVYKNVAKAYHNRVLRSIMIRQPNSNLIARKKNVENYLFFKTNKNYKSKFKMNLAGRDVTIDIDNFNNDKAIHYDDDYFSIDSFYSEFGGSRTFNEIFYDCFRNAIINIDNIDDFKSSNPYFTKQNSLYYYSEEIINCPKEVKNRLVILKECDDNFEHKYNVFRELMNKHNNQRIIVFFDYDLKRKENIIDTFTSRIKKDFPNRYLIGEKENKREIEARFNEQEDSVLVVVDPAFTESVNLQSSSIIINFQIIADPVSMDQRIGRIFRLGQKNDVIIYNLADMDKLEGYSLMYLSRIGLLTSNSGDATILAGSNSEKMVAIRCNRCGKVELISESDFAYRESKNDLYCDNPECRKYGEVLTKISVTDFKCDKCGRTFNRSAEVEGYECLSNPGYSTSRGVLLNSASQHDRTYRCKKQCAMLNCSKLRERQCLVVEAIKFNPNADPNELRLICNKCLYKSSCDISCRPGTGIEGCMTCSYARCNPKPHIISFNDKWEALCPVCGKQEHGVLRPVVASSFASYIKSSWDFNQDQGRSFCDNLLKEAKKVEEIKKILDMDNVLEDE